MQKILLVVAILSTIGSSYAETQWKMASPYSAGGFQDKTHHYFAEQVANKTNEEIVITIFPDQSLLKHEKILDATGKNEIHLGEILVSLYGDELPLWEIDSLPFVADSYEKAQKLWDLSREDIAEDLDKKNVVLLYAIPWPGQNFYTKEKLNDVSYFEGKKMLAYNGLQAKVAKHLKATSNSEYARNPEAGFKNGDINTMLISSSSGVVNSMWNYSKYYTKVNAFFPKSMVFISKKKWEKLDEKTQESIREAAKTAESHGWALSKQEHFGQEAILVENGIISEEPNKSVKQAFFKIGLKISLDWNKIADKKARKVMRAFRGF